MFSLLWRLLLGSSSDRKEIDMNEISSELSAHSGELEIKTLYGTVTKLDDQSGMIDGEFVLPRHHYVGKLDCRRVRVGDQVCVQLGRAGSAAQWTVQQLLQVSPEQWDIGVTGKKTDYVQNNIGSLDLVESDIVSRLCGNVSKVNQGSITVDLGQGRDVGILLVGIWGDNFLPICGDLVIVTLRLASLHLDDISGSSVIEAGPARTKSTDGIVESWGPQGGVVGGQVYVSPSVCHHGYRARRGDSVTVQAVECLPNRNNLQCGWRSVYCSPRAVPGHREGNEHLVNLGWVLRGQNRRSKTAPSFNKKLKEYPVPNFMLEDINNVVSKLPELLEPLTRQNYSVKLASLVQLESVAAQRELDKYNLKNIALSRAGYYLSLTVEGLIEGRPSLVVGDSVLLRDPFGDNNLAYEGCIHEVRANELLLMFDDQFQFSFCGQSYDVFFVMSRSQVRRRLKAVEVAKDNLGFDLLFPRQFNCKLPQLQLLLPETIKSTNENQDSCVNNIKSYCTAFDKFKTPFRKISPTHCDVNNNIKETKASSYNNENTLNKPPHPKVQNCKMHSKYPRGDNLRRKVLLSSSSSKITDQPIDTSVWSVPSVTNLSTSLPPGNILTELPNAFSIQRASSLPAYEPSSSNNSIVTISWVTDHLNLEQKTAVRRILGGEARPLPYIIYGPPGTGKTVTLVEAILQLFLLRSDCRILVATPSNSSADLICERLDKSGRLEYGDLARLNAFQRNHNLIPANIKPFCFSTDDTEELMSVARHRIVVTTCSTAGTLHKLNLPRGHFTHVMLDEAGHVTEPESLVPLTLVHWDTDAQIILAGDPKQLGPVLASQSAIMYGLGQSLLERLSSLHLYSRDRVRFKDHRGYDPLLVTKLVNNYRSHPDIIFVPSMLFYDGELLPYAPKCLTDRFLVTNLKGVLPNPDHPLVFHGMMGDNLQESDSPSWYNPQEVWQTVLYIQRLLLIGVKKEEIGVIAPYRQQVRKIKDMLQSLDITQEGLTVGSVEEFQGQERPVIIMSTVRSSHNCIQSDDSLGFLASDKRINVALTRAQSLLILIGDPNVLARNHSWSELLRKCYSLGCCTGLELPELLKLKS